MFVKSEIMAYNVPRTSSRSTPTSLSPGVNLAMCSVGQMGKFLFQSGSDVTPGHTSSFGVPRILHTQ